MTLGVRVVLLSVVGVGCGDNAPVCPADRAPPPWTTRVGWDCRIARGLASRDASGLVVSQEEVDAHLAIYQRGFEPIASVLRRPPSLNLSWPSVTIETVVASIAEPWSRGRVHTGVAAIDSITEAAHIDTITRAPLSNQFDLASSRYTVVNRNVAAAIVAARVSGVTVYAEEFGTREPFEEVTLEAPPTASVIPVRFQIGWGDCFVDCAGQHFWRVEVTPSTVDLVAEWGDSIPPDVLEQYRQSGPSD